MIAYGAMNLVQAAVRQERERQAMRERMIRQCDMPGFLERELQTLALGIGRVLEAFGAWLQSRAGGKGSTSAGDLSIRDVNYG
jgi:hypothetical protein